jgi:hypothetical protein
VNERLEVDTQRFEMDDEQQHDPSHLHFNEGSILAVSFPAADRFLEFRGLRGARLGPVSVR